MLLLHDVNVPEAGQWKTCSRNTFRKHHWPRRNTPLVTWFMKVMCRVLSAGCKPRLLPGFQRGGRGTVAWLTMLQTSRLPQRGRFSALGHRLPRSGQGVTSTRISRRHHGLLAIVVVQWYRRYKDEQSSSSNTGSIYWIYP